MSDSDKKKPGEALALGESAKESASQEGQESGTNGEDHDPALSTEDELGLAELGAQLVADHVDNIAQEVRLRRRMFPDLEPADEPVRLGHWILLELLGRGGAGSVYAAYDLKLERKVAIKILRPDPSDDPEPARQRILREAQALARIDHVNVVQVFSVEEREGDEVYLVMQLVTGQLLSEWQAQERSLDEIVDAYLQAARGLACIHQAGLVHRDFKPGNALVDETGRVVVVDLGLVHAVGKPPAQPAPAAADSTSWLDRSITRTGARLGTPPYMAPEQLAGRPTDARSDQFSFCVSLYEVAFGVHPFTRDEIEEAERLMRIERGELQRPGADARVPAWLEHVLRRGLSARPEERFPDMDELIRAIEEGRRKRWPWIAAGAGATALALATTLMFSALSPEPPPTCSTLATRASEEIWNETRESHMVRQMERAGISPDVREALAAALDTRVEKWRSGKELACEERRDARDEWSREQAYRRTSCLAYNRQRLEFLIDLLTERSASAGDRSKLIALAPRVADELSKRRDCIHQDNLPPVRSSANLAHQLPAWPIRYSLFQAANSELAGDYELAETRARAARRTATELRLYPLRAEALYRQGHVLGSQDDLERSRTMLLEAAKHAAASRRFSVEADAWLYLLKLAADGFHDAADTRAWLGDTRNALLRSGDVSHEHLRIAEDIEGQAPGAGWEGPLESSDAWRSSPRLADYLEGRGMLAHLEGDYEAAIAWHGRALAIRQHMQPEDPWQESKSLNNLANALAENGQFDGAQDKYEEALALRRELYGADHPMVAQVFFGLGRLHSIRGNFERGRQALERALAIQRKVFGADSFRLLKTLLALAFNERFAGNLDRAEELTAKIAAIHRSLAESQDPASATLERPQEHLIVADVHEQRGRLPQALVEVERAIEIFEANGAGCARSVQGLHYASALYDAGRLASLRKRLDAGRSFLEKALIMYECLPKVLREGDPSLRNDIRTELASTLRARGLDLERARALERAASAARED